MAQTKTQSLKETLTNTTIGMVGSWIITWAVLHVFTGAVAIATVTTLGCTVWSITRGYAVRRHFNRRINVGLSKQQLTTDAVESVRCNLSLFDDDQVRELEFLLWAECQERFVATGDQEPIERYEDIRGE